MNNRLLASRLKAVAIALLAIPEVLLGFAIYIFGAGGDLCGNDVLEEALSPSKQYKAVIFRRSCGATTGFSTHVSVLPQTSGIDNSSGNVLRTDTNHGGAPSSPNGGPLVHATWVSNNELQLVYHPLARAFTAASKIGEVRITHVRQVPGA